MAKSPVSRSSREGLDKTIVGFPCLSGTVVLMYHQSYMSLALKELILVLIEAPGVPRRL